MLHSFVLRVLVAAAIVACLGLSACSTDEPGGAADGEYFESDNPGPEGEGGGGHGADAGSRGGGGGSGGFVSAPEAGDPSRVIAEADIVQLAGDRLYALSRFGGLSVIDASKPAELKMLGRYRTEFTPFEMYVRGNVVLALYDDWGSYERVGSSWQWVQTSHLLALDVSDPARIAKLGSFSVSGDLSDSRIVGDVLYLVSYENGSCYQCGSTPRTNLLSLDVRDPRAVRKVEQLGFDNATSEWGGGARSISVTESRIYVAGPEYAAQNSASSTIQVVDISDPAGDMVPGAQVRVDGQIQSRWQMDEHDGVLRVISQPWQWMSNTPPSVQTFRIESSQSLHPLGRVELQLPRPEQLQSVRFDGTRAYAITFERTDPLFTIDLSNPAQPRQTGELEMPGFVYHMEPRGDRLLGLGFDQQNAAGALHVSVFDVSDLAAPRLLDRVNFGGDWASLPEDQDRIHKAFQVLDSEGLILVPYSGSTRGFGSMGCGGYQSGVQLVDFTRDDLTLRGAVPSHGQARRALLHRSALFTVSDDRVETFDIADRSAPESLDDAMLARYVQSSAVVGDNLVRLGNDWWSSSAQIDVVPLSEPDSTDPIGKLDLQSAVAVSRGGSAYLCGHYMMQARLFGHGKRAYVFYEDYASDFGDRANGRVSTGLAVIDLSNPAAPRLEANKVLGFSSFYGWYGWGSDSVVPSGEQVVQIGSTFALSRLSYGSDSVSERRRAWLDVVDASNPADIAVTSVPLPGQGHTGLHRSGSGVLASHYEPSSDGRVRFYIDRFDLSNPRAPRTSNEINVPGSLLAWDSASDRAITVDYKKSVREDVTPAECHEATEGQGRWLPNDGALTSHPSDLGRCTTVAQTLKQVHVGVGRVAVEGSWPVPALLKINRVSVGDDRVFVGFTSDSYYYFLAAQAFGIPCDGPCEAARSANLLVLSRLSSGGLHASTLELPGREQYGAYVSQLLAVGTRAVVGVGYGRDLRIVESAGDALREISTLETSETPLNLEKHQNSVIMSLGYNGVRVVDVSR